MIPLIILCAGLCALSCLWVFKSIRTPRMFYSATFVCAVLSLGIYLLLGSPELPAHPTPMNTQARADMKQEADFMARLEKNPQDADTMIRLAALRLIQGRDNAETLRLLDRAQTIKPRDSRIRVIRSMILNPSPEMK